MRDPNRIDRVIELLRRAWHQVPDQRLGQLVVNMLDGVVPVWSVEDDAAERKLMAFIDGHGFPSAAETE